MTCAITAMDKTRTCHTAADIKQSITRERSGERERDREREKERERERERGREIEREKERGRGNGSDQFLGEMCLLHTLRLLQTIVVREYVRVCVRVCMQ